MLVYRSVVEIGSENQPNFGALNALDFKNRATTVWKINMEPENMGPPEDENHRPNHHFQVLC